MHAYHKIMSFRDKILQLVVVPFMRRHILMMTLYQDKTSKCKDTEMSTRHEINVTNSPAASADMIAIENMWYELERPARCRVPLTVEPQHDKTNKVSVRPAKTQISLGIRPVWSVFAVRSMGSWGPKVSLCGQRGLWSAWAADLSLRWTHSHFVGFVMSRLSYVVKLQSGSDTKMIHISQWTVLGTNNSVSQLFQLCINLTVEISGINFVTFISQGWLVLCLLLIYSAGFDEQKFQSVHKKDYSYCGPLDFCVCLKF